MPILERSVNHKYYYQRNGISYVLSSNRMYYPALKYDTTKPHYGKYGLASETIPFQEHHKGYYTALLLQEKLTEHLNRVDDVVNARMDFLVSQMQKQQCVDGTLKIRDPMAWVREMNNSFNAMEAIVLNELVYS